LLTYEVISFIIITKKQFARDIKGTPENPFTLAIVPSLNASVIQHYSQNIQTCLEKKTPYSFSVTVPHNYVIVVESLGAEQTDIAFINSYGYVMAHRKYKTEPLFLLTRQGMTAYKGAFFVRNQSPIHSLKDIQGKTLALADPSSTSGSIFPQYELKKAHINPKEIVFVGKHDIGLTMLYQGQVDVSAALWNSEDPHFKPFPDARYLIIKEFPDIIEKTRIVGLTEDIPNDAIVIGAHVEPKEALKTALDLCFKEEVNAIKEIFGADGLIPSTDEDFNKLRQTLEVIEPQGSTP
jgi:phosphonate transport system substrate-binding protein